MKILITTASAVAALFMAQASLSADDISADARLAAQHVAVMTCATCHGPQGRSFIPKFPALAGQHPKYLAAQLQAFKAQTRGDPDATPVLDSRHRTPVSGGTDDDHRR